MNRLVQFHEPAPTGERDAFGQVVRREPVPYLVWCHRQDRGGAEGFTADAVVGGRWTRQYECWAEAFPPGHRPTERWTLTADDGVDMRIERVDELESGPHPVKLVVSAYRTQGGTGA